MIHIFLLCIYIKKFFRYLSVIDSPCCFDNKFFEMFKLVLNKKENKHGVLLLDKIHLRESIYVNSKELKYTGLIDISIDGPQPYHQILMKKQITVW